MQELAALSTILWPFKLPNLETTYDQFLVYLATCCLLSKVAKSRNSVARKCQNWEFLSCPIVLQLLGCFQKLPKMETFSLPEIAKSGTFWLPCKTDGFWQFVSSHNINSCNKLQIWKYENLPFFQARYHNWLVCCSL